MITIRNGQTIKIEWTILKYNSEVKEDLDKAKLLVFLVGGGNKRNMPYTLEDRVIHFTIPTDLPIGVYRLESLWLKGDVLTTSVDGVGCCMCDGTTKFRTASRSIKSDLFAVSDVDEEVSYPDSNVLEMKITTSAVSYGYDGLSAYELAVLHGEWNKDELAWLRLFFTNAEEFKEYLENYYYKKTEVDTKISKLSDHIGGEIESIDDALDTIHGNINNVENEIESVNQRINDLGSVYNVQGSLSNLNELLALNTAKKGDTYNIDSEFYLNGKYYAAGTNVVCITEFSSASENKSSNWDALGGTFNASLYLEKEKAAITNKSDLTDGIDRMTDVSYIERDKRYISGGALGSTLPFKILSKTTLDNGDIAWYRLAFSYPTGSSNPVHKLLLQTATTNKASQPVESDWETINYINNISLSSLLSRSDITNNLTTTASGKVLDARQGKVLADLIANKSLTIDTYSIFNSYSWENKGALTAQTLFDLFLSSEVGYYQFRIDDRTYRMIKHHTAQVSGNNRYVALDITGSPTWGYIHTDGLLGHWGFSSSTEPKIEDLISYQQIILSKVSDIVTYEMPSDFISLDGETVEKEITTDIFQSIFGNIDEFINNVKTKHIRLGIPHLSDDEFPGFVYTDVTSSISVKISPMEEEVIDVINIQGSFSSREYYTISVEMIIMYNSTDMMGSWTAKKETTPEEVKTELEAKLEEKINKAIYSVLNTEV